MKNLNEAKLKYFKNQLERLTETEYGYDIVIIDGNGIKTKNIKIDSEIAIELLKFLLKKG